MRGIVHAVSSVNGFAAVQTPSGEYTIVEVLGDELEVGDQVEGNLESLRGEYLTKVAPRERLSVFIQNSHVDAARARQVLSLA